MKDPLGTYLHDHLAGATFAVEMLEALKDGPAALELGPEIETLLREVEADREVLQRLVERVNGSADSLKEVVAWIAEKAARLKLRRASASGFGTFETLEALVLGIIGKEHLWRALGLAAVTDVRIQGPNYSGLAARALGQHALAEKLRLRLAREALQVAQPTE